MGQAQASLQTFALALASEAQEFPQVQETNVLKLDDSYYVLIGEFHNVDFDRDAARATILRLLGGCKVDVDVFVESNYKLRNEFSAKRDYDDEEGDVLDGSLAGGSGMDVVEDLVGEELDASCSRVRWHAVDVRFRCMTQLAMLLMFPGADGSFLSLATTKQLLFTLVDDFPSTVQFVHKLSARLPVLRPVWDAVWDEYDGLMARFNETITSNTISISSCSSSASTLFQLYARLMDIYCVRRMLTRQDGSLRVVYVGNNHRLSIKQIMQTLGATAVVSADLRAKTVTPAAAAN
jgi:hypothetical protein